MQQQQPQKKWRTLTRLTLLTTEEVLEEVESPSGKESNPALAQGSKSLDGRMGVVVAVDGHEDGYEDEDEGGTVEDSAELGSNYKGKRADEDGEHPHEDLEWNGAGMGSRRDDAHNHSEEGSLDSCLAKVEDEKDEDKRQPGDDNSTVAEEEWAGGESLCWREEGDEESELLMKKRMMMN